jgi:tetratricopeptide (TPR) repeat protein
VVGGGPPAEPALVTVACGSGYWRGYSDKHGEFIASLGIKNPRDVFVNCRVEAAISGFTRGIASVTQIPASGVLVTLYPLGRREDSTVSYLDLAVPAAARKQFEKGVGELRARKWKNAEASLRKAIAVYPAYAPAWNELGVALEGWGNFEEARKAYTRAIALDARLFSAYARCAVIDANQERWDRVAATTDAAIKLDPVEWPVLFFYNAVANFNLGRLEEAEQSATRAVATDQFPRAHYILGHILAAKGDYRAAVEHMSKYLDLVPFAADAPRVRAEIQDARSRQPPL